MPLGIRSFIVAMVSLVAICPTALLAQQPTRGSVPASKAQGIIDQAAQEGKYTFVLFYRQNDAATTAMNSLLRQELAQRSDQASLVPVQITNPAEQALVAQHDVARAPMPMTLVLAPNGAVTGVFAQKLSAESIEEAFVTPTMMDAMKSLQNGKLVFVTVRGTLGAQSHAAVRDFQTDPHFKNRTVALSMQSGDPAETKFISQMQLDPRNKTTQLVLLAPPGVVVGKFAPTASKDEIAAALANAGKCCDDPNCKHHQQSGAAKTANQAPATRKK